MPGYNNSAWMPWRYSLRRRGQPQGEEQHSSINQTPREGEEVPSQSPIDPQQPRSMPDFSIESLQRPQTSHAVLEQSNQHYTYAAAVDPHVHRHTQSATQNSPFDHWPVPGEVVLENCQHQTLKPGTLIWTLWVEPSFPTKLRPFVIIANNAASFIALPCFTHHGRSYSCLSNPEERAEYIPVCHDKADLNTLHPLSMSTRPRGVCIVSLNNSTDTNVQDEDMDEPSVVRVIVDTTFRRLHPLTAIRYTHPVTFRYSTNLTIWGHISDASLQLLQRKFTDRIWGWS